MESNNRSWKLEVRRWLIVYLTSIIYLLTSTTQAQTLADYQKQASENNPGLQAKYKEFEAAMERVAQAKGVPDPTLSISAFGQMTETRVGPQKARFTLSQMFPWFGTLKAQGDVATLTAEAKYQSYLDERNKLFYSVSATYYPLYELHQWVNIEEDNINLLQTYKQITTTKFENGNGSLVDVLRVDIILKDAETNLSILKKKEKPLLTTFNTLLNRNEDEDVVVTDAVSLLDISQDYRKDSILSNPILGELDLKLQASQASERAANKQALPNFGVGIDYIIVGKRTDLSPGVAPPPDNGQNAFMPMVSLSLPIFRGKYKAAIKEAQLMQESYTLQKQDAINSLNSGYEMIRFEMQQQMELVNLYDQQIAETDQVLNLLLTAYGNSGSDFEEVLRTEQQLLTYKKLKVSSLAQNRMALAKLEYITAK
jgi:outer membrane protein, heavy metal efflux system